MDLNVCRCCEAKAPSKNLLSKYKWMGEIEVYSNMIEECFSIKLDKAFEYNGICELCISQLRTALKFKKQIENTDKRFWDNFHININMNPLDDMSSLIKLEVPKKEVTSDQEEEMEHDGGDDGNDQSDDQGDGGSDYFIAPSASQKVEEGSDDVYIIKCEEEPKPRAPKLLKGTKVKVPIKRKPKPKEQEKIQVVETAGLPVNSSAIGTYWREYKRLIVSIAKTDRNDRITECRKLMINIKNIICYTNASIIQHKNDKGFICVCGDVYAEPTDLKRHFINKHHDKKAIDELSYKYVAGGCKLDVTYLNCAICDLDFKNISKLTNHLQSHNILFFTDVHSNIVPFDFSKPGFHCAICGQEKDNFKCLLMHTTEHLGDLVCDICGKNFVSRASFNIHKRSHVANKDYKCSMCDSYFKTNVTRKSHEKLVHHKIFLSRCNICNLKFNRHDAKIKHLEIEHNIQSKKHKCQFCDKVFINANDLKKHKINVHNKFETKRYVCAYCNKSWVDHQQYTNHLKDKHGEKIPFPCEYPGCKKVFLKHQFLKGHITQVHDSSKTKTEVNSSEEFII